MYSDIGKSLQKAYDRKVEERDTQNIEAWKHEERVNFLARLQSERRQNLLEVGAGTGIHGAFFKNAGISVISTDLSAGMVAACREKGLDAYQMDFLSLDFDAESFDAVFALNCFLHVPRDDLLSVLHHIERLLHPGGLLYWGQYGGVNYEGNLEWDNYIPRRFFAMLGDDDMKALGAECFNLLEFHTIEVARNSEHFQSGTWRKPLD